MSVDYERSGGFIGMKETLSIEGDSLRVSRRGKVVAERALEKAEQERLQGLLATVAGAESPKVAPPRASDTFRVSLMVDGKGRVEVHTLAPHAPGVGAPWDEVLQALDSLLTEELRKGQPGMPQVLGPEEL
jgi:hypothetical protein